MTQAMFNWISEEHDSLYGFYRTYYKYVDCGPSIGFRVNGKWVYCDALRALGTIDEMVARNDKVEEVMVSSIVEGTDACVPAVTLTWAQIGMSDDPWALFNGLVADVDKEAHAIWSETHGCSMCAKHWNEVEGVDHHSIGCHVWSECPICDGAGIPI